MGNRTKKPFVISLILICGYGLMLAMVPTTVDPVGAESNLQAEAANLVEPGQRVLRTSAALRSDDNDRSPLQ